MNKRKKIIIAAAAAGAVLAGGGIWFAADQSTRVSDEDLAALVERLATPAPEVPGAASVQSQLVEKEVDLTESKIVDTTDAQMEFFGYDTEYAILVDTDKNSDPITMHADRCLADWARDQLPTLDGKHFIGMHRACDKEVAVLAGGYGMTGRDLLSYALFDDSGAQMKEMLFTASDLSYASVATEDNRAVLVVVAKTPS